MLKWDNQQEIGWLTGFLEGEAHFHKKTGNITITSTDEELIEHVESILKRLLIHYTRHLYQPKKKEYYKISHIVTITYDRNNLYNFCEPYLSGRKEEFRLATRSSETTRKDSLSVGWLVGLFEAEGSFCISKNYRNSFTPKIELEMTNYKVIENCVQNLKYLGLSWYCRENVRKVRKNTKKIDIGGMLRCKRFLETLKGFWKSFRNIKRTELMLEYINSRLSNNSKNCPYTIRENEIYEEMLLLNT